MKFGVFREIQKILIPSKIFKILISRKIFKSGLLILGFTDSRKLESEVQKSNHKPPAAFCMFLWDPEGDFCTHSAKFAETKCPKLSCRISGHINNMWNPKFSKFWHHEKFSKSGFLVDFGLPETRIAKYQPFIEKNKFEVRCFSRDKKILKSKIFKIFKILISRKIFQIRTFGRFRTPGS